MPGLFCYPSTRFGPVIIGGEVKNLIAFKMVLSHSRKDAIVWSESKDMLAWLGCHTQAFRRIGGVPVTVRIDNEKTSQYYSCVIAECRQKGIMIIDSYELQAGPSGN